MRNGEDICVDATECEAYCVLYAWSSLPSPHTLLLLLLLLLTGGIHTQAGGFSCVTSPVVMDFLPGIVPSFKTFTSSQMLSEHSTFLLFCLRKFLLTCYNSVSFTNTTRGNLCCKFLISFCCVNKNTQSTIMRVSESILQY